MVALLVISGHTRDMTTTKKTATRAIQLRQELRNKEVPNFVTPLEAVLICAEYGVTVKRFSEMVNPNENPKPIAIIDVAVEIAKKGGK